jgi:hypothetical protein
VLTAEVASQPENAAAAVSPLPSVPHFPPFRNESNVTPYLHSALAMNSFSDKVIGGLLGLYTTI